MMERHTGGRFVATAVLIGTIFLSSCVPGSEAPVPSSRAQSPSTTPLTPSLIVGPRPTRRYGFGLAYDAEHRETVLYGGRDASGAVYDTWTWNGARWSELHPTQHPNEGLDLGYDAKRRKTVGFGTSANLSSRATLPPGDTWIWDGQIWYQVHPTTNPPARRGTTLTWDSKRERLIMYGGYGRPNEGLYDTWAWDGTDWHSLAKNSTDFSNLAGDAAYYPANDTVVMYHWPGGNASDPNQRFMWIFDGRSWARRPTGTIELPYSGPITYDEKLGKLILFGVHGVGAAATWTWDGASWNRIDTDTGPDDRLYPLMVYDSARGREVLFGGYDSEEAMPPSDVWEFDGKRWTQHQ